MGPRGTCRERPPRAARATPVPRAAVNATGAVRTVRPPHSERTRAMMTSAGPARATTPPAGRGHVATPLAGPSRAATALAVLALAACAPGGSANSGAAPLALEDGLADLVIGQRDLVHGGPNQPGPLDLAYPVAVAAQSTTSTRLWVADTANHRVLGWGDVARAEAGAPPDVVLGQADLEAHACAPPSATSLCAPSALWVDEQGVLYVADAGHHRVLWFADPFATDAAADGALGQPTLDGGAPGGGEAGLRAPRGLAGVPGHLWVADSGNHRVLHFSLATPGDAAARVFGQGDLQASACNRGGTPSATTLCDPAGLAVAPDGALWVADRANHRVLRYPLPLDADPAAATTADVALGQADLDQATCNSPLVETPDRMLCAPSAVAFAGADHWVTDAGNGRALRFSATATAPGTADRVLGSPTFEPTGCNAGAGAWAPASFTLCPSSSDADAPLAGGGIAAVAGDLWIADTGNSRLVRVPADPANGAPADRVVGQPDLEAGAPNRVDAAGLHAPRGVAFDRSVRPPRVYIADTRNHRVLGWRDAAALASGRPADLVLGQPNAATARCDPAGGATHDRLCLPEAVAVDSRGDLWVADRGFDRVVRFARPFETDALADGVLGQPTLASAGCDGGFASLCAPRALAVGPDDVLYVAATTGQALVVAEFLPPFSDGMLPARQFALGGAIPLRDVAAVAVAPDGTLVVADTGNHRVVIYDRAADLNADRVLGQPGLATTSCQAPSASTTCGPAGVAVSDDGTLYVADRGARVLVFADVNTVANGATANGVLGQVGFEEAACNRGVAAPGADTLCGVAGLAVDPGGTLAIADARNHRVLVLSANAPPSLDLAEARLVTGARAELEVVAADPNGDRVRLALRAAPPFVAWADRGDGTLALAAAPHPEDEGAYDVIVVARDTGIPARETEGLLRLVVAPPGPRGCGCAVGGGPDGGGHGRAILVLVALVVVAVAALGRARGRR